MNHTLLKLGAGIGLMAASATAFAGAFEGGAGLSLHGFGSGMIYAKAAGLQPLYTAFIPQGNQDTDSIVLLELTQGSGTALGTWQYFISNQTLSAASPGMKYVIAVSGSSSGLTGWAFSNSTTTFAGGLNVILPTTAASSLTFWGPIGNGSVTGGPGAAATSNGEIDLGFSFSTSISASSSATCNVSFNAYVGTDDYMQYWVQAISASNALTAVTDANLTNGVLSTAAASYTITTKSAGATSDTVSGSYTTLGAGAGAVSTAAYNQVFLPSASGTSYARTSGFTFASVLVSGAISGAFTLGSGPMKQIAACQAIGNTRLALNALGLAVGGKVGMLRIW